MVTGIYMHFPLTQNGSTPLYIASENGHSDVVNILIGNGADVNLVEEVRKIFLTRYTDMYEMMCTCYSCSW